MLEKLLTFLESSEIPYTISNQCGQIAVQFVAGGSPVYEIKFDYDDESNSMLVVGFGMPF